MRKEAIDPAPPGGPSLSSNSVQNPNREGRWDLLKRNVVYYASPLFDTSNIKKTVNLWAAVVIAGSSVFNTNADELLFIAAAHALNAKLAPISVRLAKVANLISAGLCFKNLTPVLLPFELGLLGYNSKTLV